MPLMNEIDILNVGGVDNDVRDSYTRAMIAGEEKETYSTHAYDVNQFFIWNDRNLYKVKTIISIGDTFVLNTNIELAGKISDQLYQLFANSSASLKGIISNVENSANASRNFAVREQFIWTDGNLYKVTANTILGTAWVVGTNCELSDNLTEQLRNIESNLQLANLSDVQITNIEDGDCIVWNAELGKFVNGEGGGGFYASIAVTYPNGATCTCTGNGKTQVATGSPYTFEIKKTGTYIISTNYNGQTKTQEVVIDTFGQSEIIEIKYGTINLTYDNEFKGLNITCSDGTTTITEEASSTGNTLSFTVPNTGTWEISATYDSKLYSVSATVNDLDVAASVILTVAVGTINLTYGTDFSNKTITCTDGTTIVTETTPSSGSLLEINVPNVGTWTISAELDGRTFSTSVTISDLDIPVSATLKAGTINLTFDNAFREVTLYISKTGETTISQIAPSSGNSMVIHVPVIGTWTISGTVSGSSYSTVANVTNIDSAVSATLNVFTPKTFAAATDAEIADMVARADRGEIDLYEDCGWRVGQERTTTLSAISKTGSYDGTSWTVGEDQSSQTVTLVLMHKGLYELNTPVKAKGGANRTTCSFIVGIKDCMSTKGYMNSSDVNAGSWNESARRNWCNGGIRSAFNATLRSIFKKFKTKTIETYNGSTIQTSIDYFALPAEKEIFGSKTCSNETEANALTQFTYYATAANRVKKVASSANHWWERSPYASSMYSFCLVGSDGSAAGTGASNPRGLSFFGCI